MKQIVFTLVLFVFTITSFSQDILRKPEGLLTDNARLLSANEYQLLKKRLQKFADTTTVQLSIVTIPQFEGESVEAYAKVLLDAWGLGESGKHNGMLILVAGKKREAAIVAGSDLSFFASQESMEAIVKFSIDTAFRVGKYYKGFNAAVGSLFHIAEAYNKVRSADSAMAMRSSDSMVKYLPPEVRRQMIREEYEKDPNNDWTNSPYFFGALILIVLFCARVFNWRFPASWYEQEED